MDIILAIAPSYGSGSSSLPYSLKFCSYAVHLALNLFERNLHMPANSRLPNTLLPLINKDI